MRLERQIEAEHSICTPVGPKHQDLCMGNWNVTLLKGKELEWVLEAEQYHLDIVGVSSTKCRGSDAVELNQCWKFFCSDVDVTMSAQGGVGIFVSPHLAQSVTDWIPLGGRVCLLKLRLQERSQCILQMYAPNVETQYRPLTQIKQVLLYRKNICRINSPTGIF